MSHFNVVVLGNNVEGQLAPYDENHETTPRPIDFSDSELDAWESTTSLTRSSGLKDVLRSLSDYCGERVTYNGERDEYQRWSTYNPDSKWDWYVVGGRWRGFFKLKPGAPGTIGSGSVFAHLEEEVPEGYADMARKGDIDFEGMRQLARDAATENYDAFEAIIAGTEPALPWRVVAEQYDSVEKARQAYRNQPRVQALLCSVAFNPEGMRWLFTDPIEELQEPGRDLYIARRVNNVAVPYAVLHHGHWVARGEMGWFGMSRDELSTDDWAKHVQSLYDSLDDTTLLTVVDCHI